MQDYRERILERQQQKPPYSPPQHMIYLVTDIESGYDKDNETCWGNIPIEYIERELLDEIKCFGKIKNGEEMKLDANETATERADVNSTNMEYLQIYKNLCSLEEKEHGKNKIWSRDALKTSYMAQLSDQNMHPV